MSWVRVFLTQTSVPAALSLICSTALSSKSDPNLSKRIKTSHGVSFNEALFLLYKIIPVWGQSWKNTQSESSSLTCRITLSGWLKFGELVRAFPLPGVEGHKPSNFLPHVRTLCTHTHTHSNQSTHMPNQQEISCCCGGNDITKAFYLGFIVGLHWQLKKHIKTPAHFRQPYLA